MRIFVIAISFKLPMAIVSILFPRSAPTITSDGPVLIDRGSPGASSPPFSFLLDLVLFPFSCDPNMRIALDIERDRDQHVADQSSHNTDKR
jgi:hypothetical protein